MHIEYTEDSAAFDGYANEEHVRILHKIADEIQQGDGKGHGAIRDINGNPIGQWSTYQ